MLCADLFEVCPMSTLRHLPTIGLVATLFGAACSKAPPPPSQDASYKAEQIEQLSALLRCSLDSAVVADSCPPDSSAHTTYILDGPTGNAAPFPSQQAADSALRQLVKRADSVYGVGWVCPDSSRMWIGHNKRLRVQVVLVPTSPPGWDLDARVVPGPATAGSCS